MSQINLRKPFFDNLEKIMAKDKKVIFITCDLGFSYYEKIQKRFPKRFLNVGIIESTATGIAAGLADSGFKPYLYSNIPFVIFKNYEHLRNEIAYSNSNVKIIGYSMPGFLGFTHNLEKKENEEDLLKNLPNLQRYYPSTEKELEKIMIKSYNNKKPTYIRL